MQAADQHWDREECQCAQVLSFKRFCSQIINCMYDSRTDLVGKDGHEELPRAENIQHLPHQVVVGLLQKAHRTG